MHHNFNIKLNKPKWLVQQCNSWSLSSAAFSLTHLLKFQERSVQHLHYLSKCLHWQGVKSVAPVCSISMETDNYYLNKLMQKKTTKKLQNQLCRLFVLWQINRFWKTGNKDVSLGQFYQLRYWKLHWFNHGLHLLLIGTYSGLFQ